MNLNRSPSESEQQYIWRLGQAKENGIADITWSDIADMANKEFHEDDPRMESAYRKPYSAASLFYNEVFSKLNKDSVSDDLYQQKQEIIKEQVKLRDERAALNRTLRNQARAEKNLDIIEEEIRKQGELLLPTHKTVDNKDNGNDLFVLLSDLHIGATFNNYFGRYDSRIASQRLAQYADKVIEIQKRHGSQNCYVGLLGDIISGNIHKTVAITNRENVIEQIMLAGAMVSEFVERLSRHFNNVYVSSTSGNHSRIEKKEDSLHDERLDRLIPWFVRERTRHIENISVCQSAYDGTVDILSIRNKLYYLTHGDFDSTSDTSISKLVMMTGVMPYAVCMGHRHFPMMTESSGIKVVRCGSLCGAGDQFTVEKRLVGKPNQTVMVCSTSGIETYYPVALD